MNKIGKYSYKDKFGFIMQFRSKRKIFICQKIGKGHQILKIYDESGIGPF